MNQLGGSSHPENRPDFSQQVESTAPSEQPSAQDDFSWLNSLQGSADTLSADPFADLSSEQDASKSADEQAAEIPHVAPFTPRRTEPLNPDVATIHSRLVEERDRKPVHATQRAAIGSVP